MLRFCLPRYRVASPVGPYQLPHQLVQIAGEHRPGTGHLQRLPQTFLGLIEPLCVRLQGANDPFALATLAADRVADGLGNVPCPLAFGLNANRLAPLVGERPQGRRGLAPPVVDHQRGCGVRTKDRAVPRQRLPGPLRRVHHAADQGAQDLSTAEATQEIRQAQLDLLSRLVAHKRPRLCHPDMHHFALGYHLGGDPLHDLRDEALGDLVHGLQRGDGVVQHTVATLSEPLDQQACLHDEHAHFGEQARQHLPLGPGSFSFRTWDCATGGKQVQGFIPRGALLARHALQAPKPCTQVDHHDSTASAPHRGLRRDS